MTQLTLYTFINSIHSSYQRSSLSDTLENETIDKRLKNLLSGISTLCSILTPQETIEIAIPALVRRLEERSSEPSESVWEALAEIGCLNDEEVFASIISLVLNQFKKPDGRDV